MEDIRTAPVRPREPPAIVTWPELNLVDRGPRCGARASTAGSIVPAGGFRRSAGGDPDRHHPQLAGLPLAGGDPLAELGGVEADGEVGLDHRAGDLAAGGVDPGGDVAGDDRRAAAVDRRDRRRGGLPRRAGEAGAEDRVDDRAGAGQPGVEVGRRAARTKSSAVSTSKPIPASRRRGDLTVAAVVALAADDPHRALRGEPGDRLGQRRARRPPSAAAREPPAPRSPSDRSPGSPRRRTAAAARAPCRAA